MLLAGRDPTTNLYHTIHELVAPWAVYAAALPPAVLAGRHKVSFSFGLFPYPDGKMPKNYSNTRSGPFKALLYALTEGDANVLHIY